MKGHSIRICTISEDHYLIEQLDSVFSIISSIQQCDGLADDVQLDLCIDQTRCPQALLNATIRQARTYLRVAGKNHYFVLSQQTFASTEEAESHLRESGSQFDIFIVDCKTLRENTSIAVKRMTNSPFDRLIQANGTQALTPYSRIMLVPECHMNQILSYVDGSARVQVLQKNRSIDQANLLKLHIDHIEHGYLNKLLSRTAKTSRSPIGLAQALTSYMQNYWNGRWDFHFYTGSMVANLIRSMQDLSAQSTAKAPPRCLTGNNEHSLAASALAGWQLFGRAYVICITSGMIDEFRGTLANLQRSRAPGMIVCADSPDSSWFSFQGTMDVDADGRDVIAARRIPYIYLHDLKQMPGQLAYAFQMLIENPGPVFIIATPNVLESREGIQVPGLEKRGAREPVPLDHKQLDAVMELINNAHLRMLWNCGPLSRDQQQLVYQIAHKAGIGLADLLTHPGSVQAFMDGKENQNYIGTSGVYAFSRRVYHYFHENGKLCGHDQLSQFFLKSKIDQASSPFSEGRLRRTLHIVQINSEERHISPYSDIALTMPLTDFLTYVRDHLDVNPAVRRYRIEQLARVKKLDEGVPTDYLAALPMSVNYFTLRLGHQVRKLIECDQYRFIGVYDVGRCGLSAVRNIPRTDRGFSGWYGRALMGDALSALPYIASTSSHNVLAFIGDGAKALVPNIEQQLVEAWSRNPAKNDMGVTLFYLCNGVLSMIQTYLDKRTPSGCCRQVTLPLPVDHSPTQQMTEVSPSPPHPVRRVKLDRYNEEIMEELITQTGGITIAEVVLSHNSDGDGLSLFSESSWHRIIS